MTRKILVILAVLAVALAVATVSIEAQRGGGSRGGGSGGSGGMHPEPNGNFPSGNYDTPTGDCGNFNGNYELPPGNYGPGNYEALDVCVSTDKRMYAEGEPVEIEVKAYNPLDSPIKLVTDTCQIPLSYIIDGYKNLDVCGALPSIYVLWPHQTVSHNFIRDGLSVGRHVVVGKADVKGPGPEYTEPSTPKYSDPVTIIVTDKGVYYVSTDKSVYTEGEPMEITVTAYNPTDSAITLEFQVGSPGEVGCQAYYTIDAVLPFDPTSVPCVDVVDNIPIPPGGSYSWHFTHTESVFPGSYSVVGVIHSVVGGVIYGQSAPTTIDVVAETPILDSDPSAILLKSRHFVPEPGIDQAFEAELLASEEAAVHVLLQLYHAPTDAERRLLEENNVKLLAYIPKNAWFVSIPPKNVTRIVALPEVRWVGEILPGDKISPEIRDGVDSWAINEDGTVNLIIQFFKDVSLDDAIQIISNYGGITDGRASSSNVMNIIVPNEAIIPYLATEDSVQWINEQYPIESYG